MSLGALLALGGLAALIPRPQDVSARLPLTAALGQFDPTAFCPPTACPACPPTFINYWCPPSYCPPVVGMNVLSLPDAFGTQIDLTGATLHYDAVSGQNYQLATDGSKVFADGTVLLPDGTIVLPNGIRANNGQLTLINGDIVPANTQVTAADGSVSTTSAEILKWIQTGGTLLTGVLGIFQKLGITSATGPTGGRWVSPTQYRMPDGTLVTPTRNAAGLYALPNGQVVGAPGPAVTGSSSGLLMLGALGLGVVLLMRRKAA